MALIPRNRSVELRPLDVWMLREKPKSVYLAASISARLVMIGVAYDLLRNDIRTTSSWILDKDETNKLKDWQLKKAMEAKSDRDLADIDAADVVVICPSVEPSTSGGLFVELGYAIARKKPIILIGHRPNIFFYDKNVMTMPGGVDWKEELVDFLLSPQHGYFDPEPIEIAPYTTPVPMQSNDNPKEDDDGLNF